MRKKHEFMKQKWKYYLPTLIRVPVNLFPRVFYWKFHFSFFPLFFLFYQILEESVISEGKCCKITKISSSTSSTHHEFVNVGVNWGINASKNRIVCLHRAPSFFSSLSLRLAWMCGVSPHTLILMSPSPFCATTHLISHTHAPRWCGSESQPVCDRTLLRYASRNIGEGRAAPPMFPNRTTPPAIPSN